MRKTKKKQAGVLGLIIALVVVLMGGVLFVGAVSGWFDTKVSLDTEYYTDEAKFLDLNIDEYEELIKDKKSFIIFVDQDGCNTADRLRGYMMDYMKQKGILVYRMMFSNVKESSLHEFVKYYPSVVLVSRGKPLEWLKADSDEDAEIYNNYNKFENWMNKYLVF